jgi:type I restriction enzyme S subunit
MRSNYKRIGDFIELVDERNKDLEIDRLLGLSITKEFIPSVANTVGTNMKNYKIIRKNQFACSIMQVRRDKKMPVAILKEYDEAIISQAYPVFRVVDETKLLPDYLMIWMSREEFDREACFLAVGGVRGSLEWEDFLDMELPVPSIEKQREIVAEYNAVVDRIELNEQINQKLEETAKAIYRQWFEEFEFPISKEYAESIGKPELEGQSYKSSGGEMVYNEELDKEIPKGWRESHLEAISAIIDGDRSKNYPSKSDYLEEGYCLFLNAGNVTATGFDFSDNKFISKERDNLLRKGKLKRYDTILTTRGTVGNVAYYSPGITYKRLRINSGMVILRPKVEPEGNFLYSLMRSSTMSYNIKTYLSGSAQPQLPIRDIRKMPIVLPTDNLIQSFCNHTKPPQKHIDLLNIENKRLHELSSILLSKMSVPGKVTKNKLELT